MHAQQETNAEERVSVIERNGKTEIVQESSVFPPEQQHCTQTAERLFEGGGLPGFTVAD